MRLGIALVTACTLLACDARVASPPLPTQAEWDTARAALADLRATESTQPFGAVVRVSLREPHTGRTYSARGAVAVDPQRALRMILIGPGGGTALDIWTTPEHWRFEVPAANVLRRGGRADDASLPIGFFRWWFLAPARGRLLTSLAVPGGERFVLRDGASTIDVTDVPSTRGHGHTLTASRRGGENDSVDLLRFVGAGLVPVSGDHATYDDPSSGVHVEVDVEGPSDAPDPLAFADPDAPASSDARTRPR